jgi:hypothetical protein
LAKIIPYVQQRVQRHTTGIGILSEHRQAWEQLLNQLQERTALAEAMGGSDKVTRQHQRGRLTARERIATLCDAGSFNEYGALAGGNHPGGEPALSRVAPSATPTLPSGLDWFAWRWNRACPWC